MDSVARVEKLTGKQRQLLWMLLPITAGILSSLDVLVNRRQPDPVFTYSMAAIALSPGLAKTVQHAVRTRDGFWLSQTISVLGTVATTAASYVGLWFGAAMVMGLIELYGNNSSASATIATVTVAAFLGRAGTLAWRLAGVQR